MTNHRIYIASTLSNAARVRKLRDRFRDSGVALTYDWTGHNDGQPYVGDHEPDRKRTIAEAELRGVLGAQAVLVVMPGGGGTHFEFSAAFLARVPIVLLLDDHNSYSPSFHFLNNIVRCYNEDEAVASIMQFLRGERRLDRSYLADLFGNLAERLC